MTLLTKSRLLEEIFPDVASRPSVRWLEERMYDGSISVVRVGRRVWLDPETVRADLARCTVAGASGHSDKKAYADPPAPASPVAISGKAENTLTIEEHRRIGAELKEIRKFLIRLSCDIPNTYGKTQRLSKLAIQIFEKIDRLRSWMEEQMHRDCPGEGDTGVYYT